MSSSLPTLLVWQVRGTLIREGLICPDVQLTFLLFADVQMHVCNKETYGYLPVPMRAHASLQDEAESFLHTHLEVMGNSSKLRENEIETNKW